MNEKEVEELKINEEEYNEEIEKLIDNEEMEKEFNNNKEEE